MKTPLGVFAIVTVSFLTCHTRVIAATSTFYSDLVTFSAAAGGPLLIQDFESYPHATDLKNVEILPGVSVGSNLDSVIAFSSSSMVLSGFGGRESGDSFYDINLTLPHRAVSFDITSFEAIPGDDSTAVGPGLLTVFFSDATSASLPISGNSAGSDIFFGVVSDTSITKIRWEEALEGDGGNEESGLDNFRVLRGVVPEPCGAAMGCIAVLAMLVVDRRRMAAH